ncbi:MAG: ABC transporter permease [Cyclobacteriaceae bacterium]|nr:ABC transporter permease [Cyclobacteriaceae bacterium]
MPDVYEDVIDSSRRGLFNWKELWRYQELFYFFSWRDIKIKYKQTALGFLWAVLQPLLMMLIFTLLLGRALNLPNQSLPYPVYVFSGLIIWNVFATGLTNAANSMVNNAMIIKKIYFPRLIIPVSSILVAVFDFAMAFVLFVLVLIYYQQPVAINAFVYWPASLLVSMLATLGLGCWLAALNVKYRDFRYVIPFLVQILFFVTPIIYPTSIIDYPYLQYVVASSPMYAAVEFFRFPLTSAMGNPTLVYISLTTNAVLLIIGIIYFRRTEDYFADLA